VLGPNNSDENTLRSSTVVLKEINKNGDCQEVEDNDEFTNSHPLENFLFVLKAEDSKKQYPKRLKMYMLFNLD
jgi:hypothetical protein